MTTSSLVGLNPQSFQEPDPTFDRAQLAGATTRLGAYNRLKTWLRLPPAEAAVAASSFRQAVATLPSNTQREIRDAEADALRHGFNFPDFQRLRDLALDAVSDPAVSAGFADDGMIGSSGLITTMLAMSR